MNAALLKMIGTGLFFILIFILGFYLSRSGKPYNQLIFTAHKLIALGGLVFLAVTVFKIHQVTPLSQVQIIAAVCTVLCFILSFVTGGLLSIEQPMPLVVQRLHQVLPYLTLLSTETLVYLLFRLPGL